MTSVRRQRAFLGQANGPDVELVVTGSPSYANYETADGYPVIYDDELGLYCYARVVDGRYQSTRTPVTETAPADVTRHARESDAVRMQKSAARDAQRQSQARKQTNEEGKK